MLEVRDLGVRCMLVKAPSLHALLLDLVFHSLGGCLSNLSLRVRQAY